MAPKHGQWPHLRPGELTLLDYAADDTRDVMTLSDKEALVLQLAEQIQEQQLEKALLEQESEPLSGDNVEEELATAQREFLEARATYTVRRKAARTILMTDPILKAVHLKATTPPEKYVGIPCLYAPRLMKSCRALFRLVNRRDELALAHENLASVHNAVLKQLSNLKVENLQVNRKNQELVSQLLQLTKQDSSWRERLQDAKLASQLDELEAELKTSKAKWDTMKNIASAMVVGSGLNWAEDDDLQALVLDESDD
ncbi:uncharacterized protein N7484_006190 [Penicillium longicatenatum]|uniref:uncharacterized protein n=1 Tax=Penicillium longicatenatum TaxID=1561947 RepID=UPI002546C408|nr:uncharacterized protein N7484_006190 [Penicillium longicatenatum]KAJ5643683.1 hypothetical protein N7484_006190 [Penicillium longicatenatum]